MEVKKSGGRFHIFLSESIKQQSCYKERRKV